MKNRIFKTLFLFVFGLSILQAQSITAEFDETEIGVGGTAAPSIMLKTGAVAFRAGVADVADTSVEVGFPVLGVLGFSEVLDILTVVFL